MVEGNIHPEGEGYAKCVIGNITINHRAKTKIKIEALIEAGWNMEGKLEKGG